MLRSGAGGRKSARSYAMLSVIHEKHSDIYLDRPGNAALPARGETTAIIYNISHGRLDKRRIAVKFRVENRGL